MDVMFSSFTIDEWQALVKEPTTYNFGTGLETNTKCLTRINSFRYYFWIRTSQGVQSAKANEGVQEDWSIEVNGRESWSKRMTLFCDIAPCSFVEVDRRFRGAYCLCHQVPE
jgi:hypothetical protein